MASHCRWWFSTLAAHWCPQGAWGTLLPGFHPPESLIELVLGGNQASGVLKTPHVLRCSVMSHSLWPRGLQPARLVYPWDSLGKNTGVGCRFPPPGDLPDPGIEPASLRSPALAGVFFTTSATWGALCDANVQPRVENSSNRDLKIFCRHLS